MMMTAMRMRIVVRVLSMRLLGEKSTLFPIAAANEKGLELLFDDP